jgi:hypothetical protein
MEICMVKIGMDPAMFHGALYYNYRAEVNVTESGMKKKPKP